jgi:hypothetical protein
MKRKAFVLGVERIAQKYGVLAAALVGSVVLAGPSFATDPVTTVAYTDLVAGGKTELYTAISSVGPIVFGILGVMLAVRWTWSKFSRAASG